MMVMFNELCFDLSISEYVSLLDQILFLCCDVSAVHFKRLQHPYWKFPRTPAHTHVVHKHSAYRTPSHPGNQDGHQGKVPRRSESLVKWLVLSIAWGQCW